MQIFSKKALGFINPDKSIRSDARNKIHRVGANDFHNVPDYVKDDPQFKRALASGHVRIIDSAAEAKAAENEAAGATKGKGK